MQLSITSLRTLFTSIILFVAALKLFLIWRKSHSNYYKYFTIFLCGFGAQQLLLSLGSSSLFMYTDLGRWFWTIGSLFLFIGFAYFIRFVSSVRMLKYEKMVFNASLIFSLISAVFLVLSVGRVNTSILPNGIFIYQPPKEALILVIFYSIISFGLGFVFYLAEGLKLKDRALKIRAFLISFGALFSLIGGPSHGLTETVSGVLFLDAVVVLGILMIVIGLNYDKGYQPKTEKTMV